MTQTTKDGYIIRIRAAFAEGPFNTMAQQLRCSFKVANILNAAGITMGEGGSWTADVAAQLGDLACELRNELFFDPSDQGDVEERAARITIWDMIDSAARNLTERTEYVQEVRAGKVAMYS